MSSSYWEKNQGSPSILSIEDPQSFKKNSLFQDSISESSPVMHEEAGEDLARELRPFSPAESLQILKILRTVGVGSRLHLLSSLSLMEVPGGRSSWAPSPYLQRISNLEQLSPWLPQSANHIKMPR
ncbi:hypothetical protein GJAV_G00181990 [Gymnothorax javanicus]|nr:hypothetical protein GJAV_G00181990 [Gymnothorax javanicus]